MKKLRDVFKEIENKGQTSGISTGFTLLDNDLLSMRPGDLIVIGSRPGVGKTALGLNLFLNGVRNSNLPGYFYHLSETEGETVSKMVGNHMHFNRNAKGHSIIDAKDFLNDSPIYLSTEYRLKEIVNELRVEGKSHQIGIVVFDTFQSILDFNKNITTHDSATFISKELKRLAKELNCIIILTSEMNSESEKRIYKSPRLDGLMNDGSLADDASAVLLLYRDEIYNPETTKDRGVMEIIIAKNKRNNPSNIKIDCSLLDICVLDNF